MGLLDWVRRRGAGTGPAPGEPDPRGTLLGQSLLKLEINTILKTGMTGEPMPPMPVALLDLACDYCAELRRLGVPEASLAAALFPGAATAGELPALDANLRPTFVTFSALHALAAGRRDEVAAARRAQSEPEAETPPSETEVMLTRIAQACAVISDIIRRLPQDGLLWPHLGMTREQLSGAALRLGPYPEISPTALLRVRKLWDIGTERIVAQTSIHLTGDVLMRVSPMLMEPKQAVLLDIHRDAVATSTRYWGDLMGAAVTLATGAARALFGQSWR